MHPGEDRHTLHLASSGGGENGGGARRMSPDHPAVASSGPRHQDLADAAGYWRQFPVQMTWDKPVRQSGRIIRLAEVKGRDGWIPELHLQTEKGRLVTILVTQARLLARLAELQPAVGDRLIITYHGEAERAMPGLKPAKEFSVEVERPANPPRGAER